jgi:hypothetical protein
VKSATKIVLGSIGVGVAVASVVVSFGTGWMSIIAACKGIGEVGKEVLAAALPVTKDMIKSASAIEARCVQFSGLTSKLESKADELLGKIGRITKSLTGLPDCMLATEQINLNRRVNKTVTKLFEKISELHRQTKRCVRFAAAAMKAVKKLKAEDSWLGTTETAGGVGTKGVAIYALANFCLACADHGNQLIRLLPI